MTKSLFMFFLSSINILMPSLSLSSRISEIPLIFPVFTKSANFSIQAALFIWYGSSLLGGEDIALQDKYNLYKRFPKRWLMNEKHKGDVTNIYNIRSLDRN